MKNQPVKVEKATVEDESFQVLRLHYRADEEKNDEWVRQQRKNYTQDDWEREFELKAVGEKDTTPVYPDWRRQTHESELLVFNPKIRVIYRGWDFGQSHPCVEFLQVDGLKKNFIDEMYGTDVMLEPFARSVIEYSRHAFGGGIQYIDICDATGNNKKDDGRASIKVLRDVGIYPLFRYAEVEDGIKAFGKEIITMTAGRPQVQANPSKCPHLVKAMRGGYRRNNKGVLIKDGENDHPADAARYVVAYITARGAGGAWQRWVQKQKQQKYKPRNQYTGY